MKKLIGLIGLAALTAGAQMAPQFYSANDFLSLSSSGQPLTNAITLQPWPATSATTIQGLNFVVGPAQTLTPVNGTNWFYLYPNYYRITWAGLPYAATFAVLPGAADQTNIAEEVQSGASVFWGTNNFGYQAVVDANDTTPGTLSSKIAAGAGGYMSTNNAGDDEVLVFNFPTNISTLLAQVGFTNGAMVFTMNGGGYAIANTNGGIFQVTTNGDFLATNRFGGSFVFRTNSFNVNLATPAPASLLLSNGNWTVNANESVPNVTVATSLTVGSASFTAGTGAIVFTNGTQANINCILAQVSATVWTNTVFGFSVVSNGEWNYLNASGQTMWTLGAVPPVPSIPIGNPWTIGPSGFGTAPGSSPVTVVGGTVEINGQGGATNFTASGAFAGTFNGTVTAAGTISNATYATQATNDTLGRLLATLAGTNESASMTWTNSGNKMAGVFTGYATIIPANAQPYSITFGYQAPGYGEVYFNFSNSAPVWFDWASNGDFDLFNAPGGDIAGDGSGNINLLGAGGAFFHVGLSPNNGTNGEVVQLGNDGGYFWLDANGIVHGNGAGLTNLPPAALNTGSTFLNAYIPTNPALTHGWQGYFTNGLLVTNGIF